MLATSYWEPDDDVATRGVVVLAHGYAEHHGRFAAVADVLTDSGFAVVTHDARGHGSSTGVPFGVIDNFDSLVTDFVGLARHAQQRYPNMPTFLYGHSMGGLAVLRAAERGESRRPALDSREHRRSAGASWSAVPDAGSA